MGQSCQSAYRFCLSLATLFFTAVVSHGDVVVYQGQDQQFNELLERYSDTGTDLGLFSSFKSESCDGLFSAPNGDIYALSNVLGGMTILRYSSSGQLLATSHSPLPFESGAVVVRNSTLLTASATSPPTIRLLGSRNLLSECADARGQRRCARDAGGSIEPTVFELRAIAEWQHALR